MPSMPLSGPNTFFAQNLLQTPEILRDLKYPELSRSSELQEKPTTIELRHVPCSILAMDFFDKIFDFGIALEDGTIRKCFEDYVDDVVVADELRTALLVDESDSFALFGSEEREQFVFRIFQHLVIGGRLNQYEDNVNPYLAMTKMLYRDLVCVRKTGPQKAVTIVSKVFAIECKMDNRPIIPSSRKNRQDFLYVIINPTLKNLTLFSNVG